MSIVLYALLFVSAPKLSKFFYEPQLVIVLRVLALVLIINAFGLVQKILLIKKINFKAQTKISLISSITSGVIAIIFAYLGYGVWSLVIKTLSMQFIQVLLLSLSNRWVPSPVFRVDSFKRFFEFGWKLLLSGLINTLYLNLYFLIIGRMHPNKPSTKTKHGSNNNAFAPPKRSDNFQFEDCRFFLYSSLFSFRSSLFIKIVVSREKIREKKEEKR
jgi:O-antigen/teichoic acid export membrane protein